MALDLVALATELTTDPTGLGYNISDPVVTHGILNLIRTAIQISEGVIDSRRVVESTVFAELEAVSAEKQRLYLALTGTGEINVDSANVVAGFAQIFPAGSTRTALNALRTRDGSRAEELFGENVPISRVREVLA